MINSPDEVALKVAPVPRRRFFKILGSGGVGIAVATFGKANPAFASNAGCCNLAYPPGDPHYVSYSTCANSQYLAYSWVCTINNNFGCSCCEMSRPGAPGYPGYTNSGYQCS